MGWGPVNMKKKTQFVIVFFIFDLAGVIGQTSLWYDYKPITRQDTLAILANHVRSISRSIVIKGPGVLTADSQHVYNDNYYQATFFVSNNKIDSVTRRGFDGRRVYKRSPHKIKETVYFDHIFGWDMDEHELVVYKRIHFLDSTGQVIRTTNKAVKHGGLEGESFSKIEYVYEHGLLTEERVYESGAYEDPEFYYAKKYVYGFQDPH